MTHTKTNIVQYNEYYPFGLQASRSWTRPDAKNNFLYNGSTELNAVTSNYDLHFRNYDPVLGRFVQVDPKAVIDYSVSPYVYAGNNPVFFNDPLGDIKSNHYADALDPNIASNRRLLRYAGYGHGIVMGRYGAPSGGGRGGYAQNTMAANMSELMREARGMEWNFWMMQRGEFEDYYGLDLSTPEGKAEAAKGMSTPVYRNGTFVGGFWQLATWRHNGQSGAHLSFNLELTAKKGRGQQSGSARGGFMESFRRLVNGFQNGYFGGEFAIRGSFGAQATIVPTEGGGKVAPYSRGGVGMDVDLASVTVYEYKLSTKDGRTVTTLSDMQFTQGLGLTAFGSTIEAQRIVSPNQASESSLFAGISIFGIEVNTTTNEVFIGIAPKFKYALGGGGEFSARWGWNFTY